MTWPTDRDDELFAIIDAERDRQNRTVQLIASGTISDPGMVYFDIRPSASGKVSTPLAAPAPSGEEIGGQAGYAQVNDFLQYRFALPPRSQRTANGLTPAGERRRGIHVQRGQSAAAGVGEGQGNFRGAA